MNVNPFSYLIEKLKSKLDTHQPWISNTDIDSISSDGFYHLGTGNTNVPSIGGDATYSNLYVSGNATDSVSQIFISQTGRTFTRRFHINNWSSWNELALKSDITNVKTEVSVYDNGLFPTSKNVINSYQYCCVARNTGNGALYLLWYDAGSQGFRVGSVISGNSPSNGDSCVVSYPI